MKHTTKIEWVRELAEQLRYPGGGHAWNPMRGCQRVSPGCEHCYAARLAAKFSKPGLPFHGFSRMVDGKSEWTGKVRLIDAKLAEPLQQEQPSVYFVNSMSDLFAGDFADIDRVFAVMALCPQHLFVVLTKYTDRMKAFFTNQVGDTKGAVGREIRWISGAEHSGLMEWPLPNVWLGVSVEDDAYLRARWAKLQQVPAAKRILSLEPLLGRLDLDSASANGAHVLGCGYEAGWKQCPEYLHGDARCIGADWVIVGGESGQEARPMHPDWVRSIRDQCIEGGVPFFFKQWGEWLPENQLGSWRLNEQGQTSWHYYPGVDFGPWITKDGFLVGPSGLLHCPITELSPGLRAFRVGKRKAGHSLDGQQWLQVPKIHVT